MQLRDSHDLDHRMWRLSSSLDNSAIICNLRTTKYYPAAIYQWIILTISRQIIVSVPFCVNVLALSFDKTFTEQSFFYMNGSIRFSYTHQASMGIIWKCHRSNKLVMPVTAPRSAITLNRVISLWYFWTSRGSVNYISTHKTENSVTGIKWPALKCHLKYVIIISHLM
jgi:hypothetical protein